MRSHKTPDVLDYLERQKKLLQQRIREDRGIIRSLNAIIARETEARQLLERSSFAVRNGHWKRCFD